MLCRYLKLLFREGSAIHRRLISYRLPSTSSFEKSTTRCIIFNPPSRSLLLLYIIISWRIKRVKCILRTTLLLCRRELQLWLWCKEDQIINRRLFYFFSFELVILLQIFFKFYTFLIFLWVYISGKRSIFGVIELHFFISPWLSRLLSSGSPKRLSKAWIIIQVQQINDSFCRQILFFKRTSLASLICQEVPISSHLSDLVPHTLRLLESINHYILVQKLVDFKAWT